jgi:hypothetical protein
MPRWENQLSVRGVVSVLLFGVILFGAASAQADDDVYYCQVHWWGVGRCWRRPHRRPVLTWGVEGGVGALNEGHPFAFNEGVGAVTNAGGVWGARLGVDVLSWLGFEARYLGGYNGGHGVVNAGGDVAYLLSSGQLVLRLIVPIPYVRPYVFSGIGVYDFHLMGSRAARAASTLNSTTQAGIPIGIGVEVPLSWHVSFAVEATYHFQFSESFSKIEDISGGDLSTLTGVMRFRL